MSIKIFLHCEASGFNKDAISPISLIMYDKLSDYEAIVNKLRSESVCPSLAWYRNSSNEDGKIKKKKVELISHAMIAISACVIDVLHE